MPPSNPDRAPRKWWHTRILVVAFAAIWVSGVGLGLEVMLRYSNTPSRPATPPLNWPGDSSIQPRQGRATLIVIAHPQCACSRATHRELARIMAHTPGKVDVYVLFYAPRSQGDEWARGELWNDVALIPGVKPFEDTDGRESARFGASTSGQTILYGSDGRLLFHGGITLSRGHEGSNDGRDAVESLILKGVANRSTAPVFGCSVREVE